MLRVMKQKLQQEEAAPSCGMPAEAPAAVGTTTSVSSTTSGDSQSRIVSHIPVSVNGSVSSLSSTSSSITSSQYHAFQPLSRKEDEETHEGDSPVLTPRVPVPGDESSSVPAIKPPSKVEIPSASKQSGFRRTISFLSGDISTSHQAKRPRTEPTFPRPSAHLLLATAKDIGVLSPLHIFVRQQIEVFEASEEDLKQPAPGRRIPIQLNQVGLRCIHCKHQKARERKKRAVCYPSSVGRVYHSVSDMKFAHFPCSQMPMDLQKKFTELKDESQLQSKIGKEPGAKRIGSSNASTAQYYHDSARELGMVDGKGGIFARPGLCVNQAVNSSSFIESRLVLKPQPDPLTIAAISQASALQGLLMGGVFPTLAYGASATFPPALATGMPIKTAHVFAVPAAAKPSLAVPSQRQETAEKPSSVPKASSTNKKFLLSAETDPRYLTNIHCFVRKHVEVFAANEQDLAAPAPGRKKPIVLGQVGLRCVHCARLPIKERVKRAICFPPSVSGVYHAVSNMKFDHFKICKGMPKEAREEFQSLVLSPSSCSSTCGKPSGDGRPRVSNSTAQYYHDSALRMGLIDTKEGIRFSPTVSATKDGEKVPEGLEALITAAEQRQSGPSKAV